MKYISDISLDPLQTATEITRHNRDSMTVGPRHPSCRINKLLIVFRGIIRDKQLSLLTFRKPEMQTIPIFAWENEIRVQLGQKNSDKRKWNVYRVSRVYGSCSMKIFFGLFTRTYWNIGSNNEFLWKVCFMRRSLIWILKIAHYHFQMRYYQPLFPI